VIEQNETDFKTKKEEIIKPALEEIVNLYGRRGLILEIVETDAALTRKGVIRDATIGLDTKAVFSEPRGEMRPEFRLSYSRRSRKLGLYTTTPSQGSPGGGISLDEITREWIHERFLAYVAPEKRREQFGKTVD